MALKADRLLARRPNYRHFLRQGFGNSSFRFFGSPTRNLRKTALRMGFISAGLPRQTDPRLSHGFTYRTRRPLFKSREILGGPLVTSTGEVRRK